MRAHFVHCRPDVRRGETVTFIASNTGAARAGNPRDAVDHANRSAGANTIAFGSDVSGTIEILFKPTLREMWFLLPRRLLAGFLTRVHSEAVETPS